MTDAPPTPSPLLDWLFARQRFGIHPGLGRVQALLARLGNPQEAFRAVLVGGTNGKGSTAATLAAILHADGQRVGLFTSPHLTHFAERFQVNGEPVDAAEVEAALAHVKPHAEEVGASFFEIVTALGCLLFARAGVQTAVMEVGLGGRLDATNALEPALSVITNVALDHTEILGGTREAIAGEKAGILRRGRPAVTGVQAELLPILAREEADLWALDDPAVTVRSLGWEGADATVGRPGDAEVRFRTPLLGEHGARNAALAVLAAHRLGVSEAAIQTGVAGTVWPGRMEVLPFAGGRVLLDGAHNPDGAAALVTALRALGVARLPVVFGAAGDKDVSGVARTVAPIAERVILTRAALSPRAADPPTLAPLFPGRPVTVTDSPASALEVLRDLQAPLALVCGSLYLIGEVRPLLLGQVSGDRERWQ